MLLSPQYLEHVLQIDTVKRIRMREKEDETRVSVMTYKHYPILMYYDTVYCLQGGPKK